MVLVAYDERSLLQQTRALYRSQAQLVIPALSIIMFVACVTSPSCTEDRYSHYRLQEALHLTLR